MVVKINDVQNVKLPNAATTGIKFLKYKLYRIEEKLFLPNIFAEIIYVMQKL